MDKKLKIDFLKNLLYAFSAQFITLLLNVIMSLIVPKLLGVEEFAYWQLFLFYIGYVGLFHFGFNDGLYLRLGGKNYEELYFNLIGTQVKINVVLQVFLCTILLIIVSFVIQDEKRMFILFMAALYMVMSNLCNCIGYVFQAVNKTRIYSISVIVDKFLFLIIVVVLLEFNTENFQPFVVLYVFTRAIALIYCFWIGRKIVFSKISALAITCKEIIINMSIGIKLTISNITSSLIVGIGRQIIDYRWGLAAFGKFSFSLSLCTFILNFISQISMVLFPALRKIDGKQLKNVYHFGRDVLDIILPLAYLAYVPIYYVCSWWLPQYQESLKYLGLLLPYCIFEGKMSFLCTTYFKVLREENKLLLFNVITMIVSLVTSLIGAHIANNIYFVVLAMVVSIIFRSIISELYLARIMETKILAVLVENVLLAVVFMVSTWVLPLYESFFVCLTFYVAYLIINKEKLQSISERLKNILKK